jgi:hypothetical protein
MLQQGFPWSKQAPPAETKAALMKQFPQRLHVGNLAKDKGLTFLLAISPGLAGPGGTPGPEPACPAFGPEPSGPLGLRPGFPWSKQALPTETKDPVAQWQAIGLPGQLS